MQTTIENPISCYGIGVHSGRKTQVTLKPAKQDMGVVFVRTDVSSVDNKIYASYENVFDTTLSTSIKNIAGVQVSTIEHLMAAVWGCGLSNVIVEIDGPEVPIMDGSSKPFVFMIECAGVKELNAPKKYLKLLKDVHVSEGDSEIFASPAKRTHIDLTINFDSLAIGRQQYIFTPGASFKDSLADARTFGFIRDLEYLQSKGLAKGASLENAIGIDKDVILNQEGLRHDNEFVRHKLLDLLGDLFSAGGEVVANLQGFKTSHSLNNKFLRKVFSDQYSYKWVDGSGR